MLKFFSSFDYYISFIYLITFLGGFAFWKLSKEAQKKTIHRLLFGSLLLVFFYENLAYYLVTKRTFNVWVYLIFFHHVAACLNLLIIQEFLLERKRKLVIRGFLGALLLFSGVPLLLGIIPITDSGEYTALLGASFIIISSWMFFYELLLDDRYLAINPIRYSGFWIVTILLFLYSGSFTILISYSYLINNYVDMYYIVIEVTKFSALMLYLSFFLTLAKWKGFTQIKPTYSHE